MKTIPRKQVTKCLIVLIVIIIIIIIIIIINLYFRLSVHSNTIQETNYQSKKRKEKESHFTLKNKQVISGT